MEMLRNLFYIALCISISSTANAFIKTAPASLTRFHTKSATPLQNSFPSLKQFEIAKKNLYSVELAAEAAASGSEKPAASGASGTGLASPQTKQNLKVLLYFAAWFWLNAYYNISNKRTLNMVAIPWIVSSTQLVVGAIYIGLVWLLKIRPAPTINKESLKAVFPLAALHTGSHISAVIGLGAGAVGFFHIVKSLEPLFTATINALLLKIFIPIPVAASLLPVVGGVALASLKELSFSWVSFLGAMGSNICAATRGVLAKKQMGSKKLPNLDPGNLYGLTTIIGALLLTPAAWIVEGSQFKAVMKAAELAGHSRKAIMLGMIMSGFYFYTYNEVAFYCLGNIDATTHAVGNTVKRVILLCVSVLVFGHKLTPLGLTGSGTAILGVLVYSLLKNHYATKDKKA